MALVTSRGRPPAPSAHTRRSSVDLSYPTSGQHVHGLMLIERLKKEAHPPPPSSPNAASPTPSQPGSPRTGHVAAPELIKKLQKIPSANSFSGVPSPYGSPAATPPLGSPRVGFSHSQSMPRAEHQRHQSWQGISEISSPASPRVPSSPGGRSRLGRQQSLGKFGYEDQPLSNCGPQLRASPSSNPNAPAPPNSRSLHRSSSFAQESGATRHPPIQRFSGPLVGRSRRASPLAPLFIEDCQPEEVGEEGVLLAQPLSPVAPPSPPLLDVPKCHISRANPRLGPPTPGQVNSPRQRPAFSHLDYPPSPAMGASTCSPPTREGGFHENPSCMPGGIQPPFRAGSREDQPWDFVPAAGGDVDFPRVQVKPSALTPRAAPSPRRVPASPSMVRVPRRLPSRLSAEDDSSACHVSREAPTPKAVARVYQDLEDKGAVAPSPKGAMAWGLGKLNKTLGLVDSKKANTSAVLTSEHRDIERVYQFGKVLGKGQFGVIREVRHRTTGELLACKTISKANLKTKNDVEDVRREHSILKMLQSQPHVCQVFDTFEDSQEVHLVMEMCQGGDLFDRVKERRRFPEAHAARVMRTVLQVLEFCHNRNIVHRDIKPENILLTSKESDTDVKVIDFGIATQMEGGKPLSDLMGSLTYMAPEVLRGNYGCEADMWSAGALVYVLLFGGPPFWSENEAGLIKAIKEDKIRFSRSKPVSAGAEDFILSLLDRDKGTRLTATQALRHPWLRSAASGSAEIQ